MDTAQRAGSAGGPGSPRSKGAPNSPTEEHAAAARVQEALKRVPRHLFLPVAVDRSAPEGARVSVAPGRRVPSISVVAMMLQALELDGAERVLDIGTGSGYQAALLGQLAREVYSIEIDHEAALHARTLLSALGCKNVHVIEGDAGSGWPAEAPYQGIVVGAGASEIPLELINELEPGGRLVIPLGDVNGQLVHRVRKHVDVLESETLGACNLDMLIGMRAASSHFPWTAKDSPGASSR